MEGTDSPRINLVERRLDTAERIFAGLARVGACTVVTLFAIDGPLTASTLERALHLLPKRHPRLGTRVRWEDDGPVFTVAGATALPLRTVEPTGPEDWPKLLEAEYDNPIRNDAAALLRVTFAPARQSGDRHALILVAHHSMCDLVGLLRIASDTLDYCAQIDGGSVPVVEVRSPIPPLDARLPARAEIATAADPEAVAVVLLPVEGRASLEARRQRVLLDSITASVFTAVRDRARQQGATVNGLITALALESLRTTWGPLPGIRVGTALNVRPLCEPPVSDEDLGCFVGIINTNYSLEDEVPLWDVARRHSASIRRRAGGWPNELRQMTIHLELVERMILDKANDWETQGRDNPLDLSNVGAVELGPFGPLQVTAMYTSVTNQPIGNSLQLTMGTLAGVFCCSLAYVTPLVGDERARAFFAGVIDGLHGVAAQAGT